MGLSVLSAFEIQGNSTLVATYLDRVSGKYGYSITHDKDRNYRLIVTCDPLFGSEVEAFKAGDNVMQDIKRLNLNPQRKTLVDAIGGEEVARTVDALVQASRGKS